MTLANSNHMLLLELYKLYKHYPLFPRTNENGHTSTFHLHVTSANLLPNAHLGLYEQAAVEQW